MSQKMIKTPVELLSSLVSVNTVNPPGNELFLAEQIASELKDFGFEVETPLCGENRASVVATLKIGSGVGKKVVLNGHLDVVPCNSGEWSTDPFVPTVKDNRLYGRGSADMKAGVACMILAAEKIATEGIPGNGTLVLNFVADEEIHNLGTLSSQFAWKDADYVVIGEPTNLEINIAHKGTARFYITILGKSCHSSMPSLGINAIEKAARVIDEISAYNRKLSLITHEVLSPPTCAITNIAGGEKDNIIPQQCVITVDRRMSPLDTKASVAEEITTLLKKIKKEDPDFNFSIENYICLEAGEVKKESEVIVRAQDAYRKALGREPIVTAFSATCEQCIFTKNGVPAFIMGPGSINQAHVVDEYVEINQLQPAIDFYYTFAKSAMIQ